MFLLCSIGLLCSLHEPSILTCPQAPAGHGALRAGGCTFVLSRTRGRDRARAAARPRRAIQRQRPLRGGGAGRLRRRLAEHRGPAAVQDHGRRSTPRARSSPATTRPTSASTARSTRTAAASTAASTVSPGRRTPISACRRASTSNRNCLQSPTRRSCWKRNWRRGLRTADDRDRHQHRSLSADRARAEDHARHPRGAGTGQAIRSASSPNRRW